VPGPMEIEAPAARCRKIDDRGTRAPCNLSLHGGAQLLGAHHPLSADDQRSPLDRQARHPQNLVVMACRRRRFKGKCEEKGDDFAGGTEFVVHRGVAFKESSLGP